MGQSSPELVWGGAWALTLSLPLNPWVTWGTPLSLLRPGVSRLGMWVGALAAGLPQWL